MIERNALCPCGSNRKYKKCCMGKDEAAARAARRVPRTHRPDWYPNGITEGLQHEINRLLTTPPTT